MRHNLLKIAIVKLVFLTCTSVSASASASSSSSCENANISYLDKGSSGLRFLFKFDERDKTHNTITGCLENTSAEPMTLMDLAGNKHDDISNGGKVLVYQCPDQYPCSAKKIWVKVGNTRHICTIRRATLF